MERINKFPADSIWLIGEEKKSLKEWCVVYDVDIKDVQQRLHYGNTLLRSLKLTKRHKQKKSVLTLEQLKEQYKPKVEVKRDDFEKEIKNYIGFDMTEPDYTFEPSVFSRVYSGRIIRNDY